LPANHVSVITANGRHHVRAVRPFAPGETVLHLYGEPVPHPDRHTIQIDFAIHLGAADREHPGEFHPWRYLNHACEPNTVVHDRDLVAVQPLEAGAQVTFNYNTTEYDMAAPFQCHCGSTACIGEIRGFCHLDITEKRRLAPLLAPHLKRLLDLP
jgi:hypothetical protein